MGLVCLFCDLCQRALGGQGTLAFGGGGAWQAAGRAGLSEEAVGARSRTHVRPRSQDPCLPLRPGPPLGGSSTCRWAPRFAA